MKACYCRYRLEFKEPATTSRETMRHKDTYFVKLWHEHRPDVYGLGECALFRGLGADDVPDYQDRLHALCAAINRGEKPAMPKLSSMRFGLETALADLDNGGVRLPFPSPWAQGKTAIPINGLVWMGSLEQMCARADEKLRQGFRCIKFKIGALDFDHEVDMLNYLRRRFTAATLEIRLDANGAFSPDTAMARLETLAPLSIHSIEQPIRQRQYEAMAEICRRSPIPIALDEELIGIDDVDEKQQMLEIVRPQYIILKPSLCGGFAGANEWISQASARGIGWWATSALESNVGLNAIAQWVSRLGTTMPQGLGTGKLYTNNIASAIRQSGSVLTYNPDITWNIPEMEWIEPL